MSRAVPAPGGPWERGSAKAGVRAGVFPEEVARKEADCITCTLPSPAPPGRDMVLQHEAHWYGELGGLPTTPEQSVPMPVESLDKRGKGVLSLRAVWRTVVFGVTRTTVEMKGIPVVRHPMQQKNGWGSTGIRWSWNEPSSDRHMVHCFQLHRGVG